MTKIHKCFCGREPQVLRGNLYMNQGEAVIICQNGDCDVGDVTSSSIEDAISTWDWRREHD